MKRRNLLLTILLLIALAIGLTACSKEEAPQTDANEDQTQAAEQTDDQSDQKEESEKQEVDLDKPIVLGGTRNIAPGEKDAYYCSSILMVWEPLITINENYEPTGKLASEYSHNEDFTEWTFHLKEGVTFHDGTPFNADSVIANFDRMKKGVLNSNFYSLDITTTYPGLKEVKKDGDYTIVLSFEEPLPTLDYAMTDFGSPIFAPSCFTEDGYFNGFAIGTGPFKLVENKLDEYTTVERFEDYYGEKAQAKTITVKTIPDPDTRVSALKAEEIMGVIDLGAIQPNMAVELVKDEKFAYSQAPNTITHYILTNGTKEPFSSVEMRQALSLLIDRKQIVDTFYAGMGTPSENILNQTTTFTSNLPIKHDPDKAVELAKSVLGDETKDVKIILSQGELARYPNNEEAQFLQSELKKIGLNATIQQLDSAAYFEALSAGDYDISLKIKGLSSIEPNSLFTTMMKTDTGLNKKWSFGYSNPKVDELIAQATNELDMQKRSEIYNELQLIAAEEFPCIPYFDDVNLVAYNKKIEDYNVSYYGVTLDKVHWVVE